MRLSSTLLLPLLSLLSFTSAQSQTASSTASFQSSFTRSGSSVAPTASPSASFSQHSTSASSSLPPLPSGSLLPNGTFIWPNGTSNATATNVTAPLAVPYLIKLDGAYGVAGAILILTGIPIATLGGKNRWSSLFLIPFYTVSVISVIIVLHFGLPPQVINSPSPTLRGLFVLISVVVGIVGGGVGLFFWNQGKYLIPFVGGWSLAWFVLCLKSDGTIKTQVWRWVLLVGCSAGCFIGGLFNSLHNPMVVLSTAWIGSTAFVLGVDCFTRLGLKEFYIYNLGFGSIFADVLAPQNGIFLLSQGMQIELGVLGVVGLLGAAIQFKAYSHLRTKLSQISAEDRRRTVAEEEAIAARRLQTHEAELEKWEAEHGSRNGGGLRSPQFGDEESTLMGVNSYKGEAKSMERTRSSFDAINLLPTLDLGTREGGLRPNGGGHALTSSTATASTMAPPPSSVSDDPELKEKEKLLQEILTIRKSIEALRSSSPTAPVSATAPAPPPTLSPTQQAFFPPPTTTHSRQSTHSFSGFGEHARRTSSPLAPAPLVDASPLSPKTEWDEYLAKRVVYRPTSPEEQSTFRREEGDHRSSSFSGGSAHPRASGSRPGMNERRSSMMSMQGIMEGGGGASAGMDRISGSRRSSTFTLPSVLLPPTAATSSSSKPRPPPAQRTLSQSDLAARHREKIKTLQSPIDERFEAAAARAKWEKDKAREREEMGKREEEAKTRVSERKRRSEVDVEGWRGSVFGKGSMGGRRESQYSLGGDGSAAPAQGGGGAERRRR